MFSLQGLHSISHGIKVIPGPENIVLVYPAFPKYQADGRVGDDADLRGLRPGGKEVVDAREDVGAKAA